MKLLNLGCGQRYHPDWVNVDFASTRPGVRVCDLRQGIPFQSDAFDVVYHSHVLEHFSRQQAVVFIQECFRVLCPQGVLRVVVPDLEDIARCYLTALQQALQGSEQGKHQYEWFLLEMYDQVVREVSGGEMLTYLSRLDLPHLSFLLERGGTEVRTIVETARREKAATVSVQTSTSNRFWARVKVIYRFLKYSDYRRESLLKWLLGQEYSSLQLGRFRRSGEIHQWMYDRYSLAQLLAQCGFVQVTQQTACSSLIPHWTDFDLDTEPDGTVYKPESLFMEAVKPA